MSSIEQPMIREAGLSRLDRPQSTNNAAISKIVARGVQTGFAGVRANQAQAEAASIESTKAAYQVATSALGVMETGGTVDIASLTVPDSTKALLERYKALEDGGQTGRGKSLSTRAMIKSNIISGLNSSGAILAVSKYIKETSAVEKGITDEQKTADSVKATQDKEARDQAASIAKSLYRPVVNDDGTPKTTKELTDSLSDAMPMLQITAENAAKLESLQNKAGVADAEMKKAQEDDFGTGTYTVLDELRNGLDKQQGESEKEYITRISTEINSAKQSIAMTYDMVSSKRVDAVVAIIDQMGKNIKGSDYNEVEMQRLVRKAKILANQNATLSIGDKQYKLSQRSKEEHKLEQEIILDRIAIMDKMTEGFKNKGDIVKKVTGKELPAWMQDAHVDTLQLYAGLVNRGRVPTGNVIPFPNHVNGVTFTGTEALVAAVTPALAANPSKVTGIMRNTDGTAMEPVQMLDTWIANEPEEWTKEQVGNVYSAIAPLLQDGTEFTKMILASSKDNREGYKHLSEVITNRMRVELSDVGSKLREAMGRKYGSVYIDQSNIEDGLISFKIDNSYKRRTKGEGWLGGTKGDQSRILTSINKNEATVLSNAIKSYTHLNTILDDSGDYDYATGFQLMTKRDNVFGGDLEGLVNFSVDVPEEAKVKKNFNDTIDNALPDGVKAEGIIINGDDGQQYELGGK